MKQKSFLHSLGDVRVKQHGLFWRHLLASRGHVSDELRVEESELHQVLEPAFWALRPEILSEWADLS